MNTDKGYGVLSCDGVALTTGQTKGEAVGWAVTALLGAPPAAEAPPLYVAAGDGPDGLVLYRARRALNAPVVEVCGVTGTKARNLPIGPDGRKAGG